MQSHQDEKNASNDGLTSTKTRIDSVLIQIQKLKPLLDMPPLTKTLFRSWLEQGDGLTWREMIEEFSSDLEFLLKEQNVEQDYRLAIVLFNRGLTSYLVELLEAEEELLDFLYYELCGSVALDTVQQEFINFIKISIPQFKNTTSEFPIDEEKIPSNKDERQKTLEKANEELKKNEEELKKNNVTIPTPENSYLTSTSKVFLKIGRRGAVVTTLDEYADTIKPLLKNKKYSLKEDKILDVGAVMPSLLEDTVNLFKEKQANCLSM